MENIFEVVITETGKCFLLRYTWRNNITTSGTLKCTIRAWIWHGYEFLRTDSHFKNMTANHYLSHVKFFRSKFKSRRTQLELYQTLIRLVLICGSELWPMNTEERNALRIVKRKILRKIYGYVKEENRWRIRTNKAIEEMWRGKNFVKFIKSL